MKYKLRFHLAKGKNFMKWQLTSPSGEVSYFSPDTTSICLFGCKLRNRPSTAKRIYEGENKSVCAWVEAEDIQVLHDKDPFIDHLTDRELYFNPKRQPHWAYQSEVWDIDNKKIPLIVTRKNRLYEIAKYSVQCEDTETQQTEEQ